MKQIIVDTPEQQSSSQVQHTQTVQQEEQQLPQTGGHNQIPTITLGISLSFLIFFISLKNILKKRGDN